LSSIEPKHLFVQFEKGDKQMNTKGKISTRESKTQITTSTLMRWAGLSAMVAGLCFLVIGMFHPVNVPASVTTATWVNVHIFAFALGFFGLFGMAGLYARQAEKSGWLGLAGFVLFSVWMTLVSGFSFVEAFILPRLTSRGVRGWFPWDVYQQQDDLGILPTFWNISGPLYIFGPLLWHRYVPRSRPFIAGQALCLPSTSYWFPLVPWFPLSTSPRSSWYRSGWRWHGWDTRSGRNAGSKPRNECPQPPSNRVRPLEIGCMGQAVV
jgi:hypothetical protein